MPYVNRATVEVLAASAKGLRKVLDELEAGEPVNMMELEAAALSLFSIVEMLQNLSDAGPGRNGTG